MMGFMLLNYLGCHADKMTRLRTAHDNGQVIFLSVSFLELWHHPTFVIINTKSCCRKKYDYCHIEHIKIISTLPLINVS